MYRKKIFMVLIVCLVLGLMPNSITKAYAENDTVYPYYVITKEGALAENDVLVYKQLSAGETSNVFVASGPIGSAITAVRDDVADNSATLHFGLTGTTKDDISGKLNLENTIYLDSRGTYTIKGDTKTSISMTGASLIMEDASIDSQSTAISTTRGEGGGVAFCALSGVFCCCCFYLHL